jgi:SAM-dependent methyltransferase
LNKVMLQETIAFLRSAEGQEWLTRTNTLPKERLQRLQTLRRDLSPENARAVVELLELRARAKAKFSSADLMYFTREGLEQSTGEVVARYRAERLSSANQVLDACCGIGGDALALLEHTSVIAVDQSPYALACLQANADALMPHHSSRLHCLCADVTLLDLKRLRDGGVDAVLFDPARRIKDRTGASVRANSGEAYSPPLSWLEALRALFPTVAVKLSPATEEELFQQYAPYTEIELISTQGECKEAVLWFGKEAKALPQWSGEEFTYRATVLHREGAHATFLPTSLSEPLPSSPPQAWLYEPEPALIRAHLTQPLALEIGARPLTPQIAYLTSPQYTPTPFAKAYHILEAMPYRPKEIQKWLRQQGREVVIVKKRGVNLEPEQVRKTLQGGKGTPTVLVLLPYQGKTWGLLCEEQSSSTAAHRSEKVG